ncbi:uncharacterized protein trim32l.S [Xenopus laevis]|uniref:Uncharacterized protein n=2 Tax=Xenopus laevis TaxID=8355 RepID=A0A974DK29_XENLA|nr:uncharacterized protein trim32l.S [Xenopus laevis]OCT93473.1 hypothetical protein XELAEV_18016542mg [Xenopus laevis]
MSYFKVLLSDLTQTCLDLEQIKAEHTKDHEQISRSFERTLLSILKQEQTILTLVEEEHRRLKDQLSSVQKANDLALQNGVFEINTMVHEISTISTQLKQMLATSNDSDPVVKEIQKRVATIFARKKSINIRLQKAHFTPHPLVSLTLGEINCEGQSLGFSIPCLKPQGQTQSDLSGSALLLNESPPWEEISQSSDDPGCVSVKIILGDDSDQDSVSITKGPEMGVTVKKQVNTSPREQAIKEANNGALSPRTATKIWISDIKQSPSRQSRPTGIRGGKVQRVLSEGHSMTPKSDSCTTTHLHKESQVLKGLTMAVTSTSGETNLTNASSTKTRDTTNAKELQTPQHPMNSPAVPIKSHTPLSRTGHPFEGKVVRKPGSNLFRVPKINPDKNGLECALQSSRTTISKNDLNSFTEQNGYLLTHVPDHETMFKATATYVCDNSSDEGLEEGPRERDPKTCWEEAIRVSQVPSAKKDSNGEDDDEIHSMRSYQNTQNKPFGSTTETTSPPDDNHLLSECPPRPPSPAESVQSSYTFIIDSPRRRDATDGAHKPRSVFRLASKDTSKGRPVIRATDASSPNCAHALKPKQHRRVQSAGSLPGSLHQGINNRNRRTVQGTSVQKSVLRSASMPYIERLSRQRNSRTHRPLSASDRRDSSSSASSCWSNPRTLVSSAPPGSSRVYGRISQNRVKSARSSRERLTYKVDGFSKSESNLVDCQRVNGEKPKGLVRQFGKFGSGRAELNLPHGLYATKAGSLYVVDYGNRRLQIMNPRGKILQQIALEAKNYFDVAVSNRGLVALSNSTDRTVEVYNKYGRLLQVISKNFGAPRGITTSYKDEFIVADMKLGTICTLILHPVTGCQKESTIIPGFNKPYLVASNSQGLLAITERGLDGGCCVKVLGEDCQILKILGLKETPGPKLCNPWGVCIDSEGGVMVADWGNTHSIVYYPPKRPAKVLVSEGLSSPRGLALWQDTQLLVADSMHNCIKVFQYQDM